MPVLHRSCRHSEAGGFTLIELLVVLAIIAMLIGILLPALGRARDSGRGVTCLSSMRQLAVGHAMYADANADISLPGRMAKIGGNDDPRNHYEVGNGLHFRPRWMVTMGAASGFYAFTEPSTDPGKDNDNNKMIDNPVFRDPTVPERMNNRNYAYGYNFQFLGNTRKTLDGARLVRFPVRLSRLFGQTVLFADAMGTAATFREGERLGYNPTPHPSNDPREEGNHAWSLDPPRLTDSSDNCDESRDGVTRSSVDERHGGRANVLWLDGHGSQETAAGLGYAVGPGGAVAYRGAVQTPSGEQPLGNALFSGDRTDSDPPAIR
jgi:prepilin-type N-terminal cleavage/methylation domain